MRLSIKYWFIVLQHFLSFLSLYAILPSSLLAVFGLPDFHNICLKGPVCRIWWHPVARLQKAGNWPLKTQKKTGKPL